MPQTHLSVSNVLWAFATMRREPGEGLMRVLEGRAEALAGTFNAQLDQLLRTHVRVKRDL
jgi:hypothetical protein